MLCLNPETLSLSLAPPRSTTLCLAPKTLSLCLTPQYSVLLHLGISLMETSKTGCGEVRGEMSWRVKEHGGAWWSVAEHGGYR